MRALDAKRLDAQGEPDAAAGAAVLPYRETSTRLPMIAPLIVWPLALLSLVGVVVQVGFGIPIGTRPAPDVVLWSMAVMFGVLGPVLLWSIRLQTRVEEGGVRTRLFPLMWWWRRIPAREIRSVEAVRYRPIAEWGGWGIRWKPGWRWAYTMHGDRGVYLVIERGAIERGGRSGGVLIGSDEPARLAAAITALVSRDG